MGQTFTYWGDLWVDQAALTLFERLLGYRIPRDDTDKLARQCVGIDTVILTPIELDHFHIEFSGDFDFGDKLERMVWDARMAGYFIEGHWAEQGQVDGFWMSEWKLTDKGFHSRTMSIGDGSDTVCWEEVILSATAKSFVVVYSLRGDDEALPTVEGPLSIEEATARMDEIFGAANRNDFVVHILPLAEPCRDPCREVLGGMKSEEAKSR